jgi:hypothetical protein
MIIIKFHNCDNTNIPHKRCNFNHDRSVTYETLLEGKGKGQLITCHGGPRIGVEVQLYSFSTSTLGEVDGQHHVPAALPPGKTRYPLYRRLDWPQDRSGRVRKISPPPGFDPRIVNPLARRYTD